MENDLGYAPNIEPTIGGLINLFKRHKGRISIISGAGISSHLLPTFRSHNDSGLWESFSSSILSKASFYQDSSAQKNCWKLISNIRNLQVTKRLYPSYAHHIIHYLHQRGFINYIITQNIDGLHSFRGDTDHVIELHGKITDEAECENCQKKHKINNLQILHDKECPLCPDCGSPLKPPVAFFGDLIDPSKREETNQALFSTDVLILVGTHCLVDPIRSMVIEAKRNGIIIVEINIVETPASPLLDIRLVGTADDIFKQIAKELLPDIDFEKINLEQRSSADF